jgi:hypothetical protein
MYGYTFPAPAAVVTPEQVRSMANARAQNVSDGLVEPPRSLDTRSPLPTVAVPSLQAPDKARLMAASARAHKLFPGPIADTLVAELSTWSELGYRLDGHGHAARLVNALMAWPSPDDEPETAAA